MTATSEKAEEVLTYNKYHKSIDRVLNVIVVLATVAIWLYVKMCQKIEVLARVRGIAAGLNYVVDL